MSGIRFWTTSQQAVEVGGFNDTRLRCPYFAFLYTLFFTGMRQKR
jgi:hypothetical protein